MVLSRLTDSEFLLHFLKHTEIRHIADRDFAVILASLFATSMKQIETVSRDFPVKTDDFHCGIIRCICVFWFNFAQAVRIVTASSLILLYKPTCPD